MQMHLCKTGYDFCKGEHSVELCKGRPDILSQAIVIQNPMNIFTAMQFFSESVEEDTINKGYTDTAHFIKLEKNSNQACDERVEHMLNLFGILQRVSILTHSHLFQHRGAYMACQFKPSRLYCIT